jgi:uncharacterized delta-60 repeat protein
VSGRGRGRLGSVGVVALACVLVLAIAASANTPGTLVATFGTNGIVTVNVGPGNDFGFGIAVQPDDKIVVAGQTGGTDFAVVRLTPQGALDPTFSGDGKLTTDLGGVDGAADVALQPDGKIVVAGSSNVGGNSQFAVARYHADGTPDTSFDGDGQRVFGFAPGSQQDAGNAVALQGDKIVVAGSAAPAAPGNLNFAVVRLNANGSSDTSFDGDGFATTEPGLAGNTDEAFGLVVQGGAITLAGYARVGAGNTNEDFALARFTSSGALDPTFDTDGKVTRPVSAGTLNDRAADLAVQSDGKLVAAGGAIVAGPPFHSDFALARFHPNGGFDLSTTASLAPGTGIDAAASLYLTNGGLIVLGGVASTDSTNVAFDSALARFLPTGELDPSFGTNGKVNASLGPTNDFLADVAAGSTIGCGGADNGDDSGSALLASGRVRLQQAAVASLVCAKWRGRTEEVPPPPPPPPPPASPPAAPPPPPALAQPPPPPPVTPPPACRCRNLQTRTSGWGDFIARGAGRTAFSFRVQWTMNCSGRRGGCRGVIVVDPPGDLKLAAPKRDVSCTGRCRNEAITRISGRFRVAGTSVASLDQDARAGKKFTFRFRKFCVVNGRRVAAGRGFLTVAYGPTGLINRGASDLNGDLKPDGAKRGRRST